MKRRTFIAGLAGAAAWPLAARAQQQMPVVGFLSPRGRGDDPHLTAAVLQGLKEAGFIEGQNVAIEYRFADSQPDRLPALAADLVRHQVVMIISTGGNGAAAAAKAATATIPIVANFGADPVVDGLVASLNRPSGNLTGISRFSSELLPKRLELLREVAPEAAVIAFLAYPTGGYAESDVRAVQAAAQALGRQVHLLKASTEREIEAVFATLIQSGASALLIENTPLFNSRSRQLAALTLRHAVPASHCVREFVVAGGLMSYAPSLADVYRQVGIYAGRVLKGEKPADLPVQQATKIEFMINLKTARSFGLTVPLPLLAFADEVIE